MLIETGFALPVSFKLMVQSTLPRPSWEERMRRIPNSNGFKKAGSFNCSSNCLPLRDFISTRKVLPPTDFSALPKPVIDFSMQFFLNEVKILEKVDCLFNNKYCN